MAYAGPSADSIAVPRAFAWSGRIFRVVGRLISRVSSEPLPDLDGRSAIMVANHRSMADVFYAVAILSDWGYPARCLVRYSYFKNRFFGGWLRAIGFIPAGGGGTDAVTEAVETLSTGRPVAVMVEGRVVPADRRMDDGMGDFRDGFVTIARKADAVVLPLILVGSDKVWGSRSKLPRFPFGRPRVEMRVGTPVDVGEHADVDVEELVRGQMAAMLARP